MIEDRNLLIVCARHMHAASCCRLLIADQGQINAVRNPEAFLLSYCGISTRMELARCIKVMSLVCCRPVTYGLRPCLS